MSAGAVVSGRPGAPDVVLIHGLASSHGSWDRVVPLLEKRANIVAVHLESAGSIEDDADDVAALLRSPALIAGHSRGGLVATALAERHPDLVSALVLLCPPWSRASRKTARGPIERALTVPGLGDLLWASASERRRRDAQRSAFAPGTEIPEQFVTDVRARGRRNFAASTRAIDAYLGAGHLAGRLANLPHPVELAFGELDGRVEAPGDRFDALPNTTTRVLPGIGHTPPWEAPRAVADLIIGSLDVAKP
ncbi:putative hydrolase, alpha/beta hydrolase family [Nocardia nova SH22a]|uniref:Putative hydrolase, alpha/beta hydrolase family n=1 Tax=Nocardia nova SH22a TaxID=1415166 RepID=W5TKW8_9NOCA|nr:alpha/beta hydrolase [Nocardia nova]AHH19814.1 putative hydrolase, alpha/beta hydrolase family [Nocardia nova SH22a]